MNATKRNCPYAKTPIPERNACRPQRGDVRAEAKITATEGVEPRKNARQLERRRVAAEAGRDATAPGRV